MERLQPALARGKIGVYPIGALSISFYDRLKAEYIICRPKSVTSAWALTYGWIIIDGRKREIGGRLLPGLVNSNAERGTLLPEIILVSPYADKLEEFLDQLILYFRHLDEGGWHNAGLVPYFLLASSGLYFENMLKKAATLIEAAPLKRKDFFLSLLERRLFRAVAYQSAMRTGEGFSADYSTGKEASYIVLSFNGEEKDRRRIIELIRLRDYDIRLESHRYQSEYDKALVDMIFCAFTQLYAPDMEKGRLYDVRFGDLLADSPYLPSFFYPLALRDNPRVIREKIQLIGNAFMEVARARGIYGSHVTFEKKFSPLEEYILSNIPSHYPSSFQVLISTLLNPRDIWYGEELLVTQRYIIEPLRDFAEAWGMEKEYRTLENFRNELIIAYQQCCAVRDNKELHLQRLSRGENLTGSEGTLLKFWTRRHIDELYGKACGIDERAFQAHYYTLKIAFMKLTETGEELLCPGYEEQWRFYLPLALQIIEKSSSREEGLTPLPPFFIAINGPPGAGKTTLANSLGQVIALLTGQKAVTLSIDDFYYTAEERKERGLSEWGPGAHDLELGERILEALKRGEDVEEMPRFDKAVRARSLGGRKIEGACAYVLFEGMGTGMKSKHYSRLSGQIDYLITLEADMEHCRKWRYEAWWNIQQAHYGGDEESYRKDFETLWAVASRQAVEVMAEVLPLSDIIVMLDENHHAFRMRKGEPAPLPVRS